MIRTKQLKMLGGTLRWSFSWADRDFQKGDKITFTCDGRGRGGHYQVTAVVDKVNPKTIKATEAPGSYRPGTPWIVDRREKEIYVELPAEAAA